jgi:hypothetical protein
MSPRPLSLVSLAVAAVLLLGVALAFAAPIRAAYFYGDMPASHVDSLGAAGFDRALIKFSTDSLSDVIKSRLRAFGVAAQRSEMALVPSFNLQSRSRLASLGTPRRYTWGRRLMKVEQELACPLDSAYWRSALVDHAEEFLAALPEVDRLLLDLEVYFGTPHHYDRGPCRCSRCLTEYAGPVGSADLSTRDLPGLQAWEEVRLARILTPMLTEFAARHPGVELGVFDLDLDSFVHRALARALARSRVPTADYCEKTYGTGSAPLAAVRGRLAALGLGGAPIIGGFWLQRWTPDRLEAAIAAMNQGAKGYFIFTSFSLWFDPKRLTGPYTLTGPQAEYWAALRRANLAP